MAHFLPAVALATTSLLYPSLFTVFCYSTCIYPWIPFPTIYLYLSIFHLSLPHPATLTSPVSLAPFQSQCITALAPEHQFHISLPPYSVLQLYSRSIAGRYIRELVLSCSQQSFTRFVSYVRLFFLRWNYYTTCTFSATTRRGRPEEMSTCFPQTMPARHRWETFLFSSVGG